MKIKLPHAFLDRLAARKHMEETLRRRDAVLEAVSDEAERFLKTSALGAGLPDVLAQLGQATEASRVYICENAETGYPVLPDQYCAWAAPGTPAGDGDSRPLIQPRWAEELSQGRIVYGPVHAMPAAERELLAGQGIRSLALVPIFVGQLWWGTIGFEDHRAERSWSSIELEALKAAAGIMGAAIYRAEAEQAEKRLMQMKDDFVANVSHELRTPLYAISGFIELLRSGNIADPATQREFLERAAHNAERLTVLVNDLLDISRLEAGRMRLDLGDVDLCAVILDTLHSLAALAEDKHLQLAYADAGDGHEQNGAPGAPLLVRADGNRVRQVLVNLVGNAIKFSEPGRAVQVRSYPIDGGVRVEVIDQGPGIAPQDLPLVFEKFYRAGSSVKAAVSGAGLGLYISRQIVEAHSGTLGVESQVGHGSTFYFTLPLTGDCDGVQDTRGR